MTVLTGENSNSPGYVHDEPVSSLEVVRAGLAQSATWSEETAVMYNLALGEKGIGEPDCEPYPDPDLFSKEGVAQTLEEGQRIIVVARKENDQGEKQIVGAMVMDSLSPYHIEFNSMAVRKDFRGQSVGTAIVAGLCDMVEEEPLKINTTELVTHSLASQAAHIHNGYNKIVGFAFCHYPKVFFADHPESVLWVSRLQGKLVGSIKLLRASLGRRLGTCREDVVPKLLFHQAQTQPHLIQRLNEAELALAAEILLERTSYVPQQYANLVEGILFQFEDILDRKILTERDLATITATNNLELHETLKSLEAQPDAPPAANLSIDYKGDYGHAYITYAEGFTYVETELDAALKDLSARDKRYILVKIPANERNCIETARALQAKGFIFHSYVPFNGYNEKSPGPSRFHDVLTLQWIKPEVLCENALPGETKSVVKIYGYPANLAGAIVSLMKAELAGK
jgi:hypothetical protein